MLPLLVRIWFHIQQYFQDALPFDYTTVRRLGLYGGVYLFRGFVLYWFLDFVEGALVDAKGNCWYSEYLNKGIKDQCYGRTFDFSDHIVLYYAQILPIFALESFYTLLQSHFWKYSSYMLVMPPSLSWLQPKPVHIEYWREIANVLSPVAYAAALVYMYITMWVATNKTSEWFHTPMEVTVGFTVSLFVQVPLLYLQCGVKSKEWRDYFFGSADTDS